MITRYLMTSLLLILPALVQAGNYHDLSKISRQVENFLFSFPELKRDSDTIVKVNSIDRRLKLAQCDKLNFNLASGSNLTGKTSIRVICSSPKSWSFYLTAHISRFQAVYIANNSLSRGHILQASDVYKSRKDLSKLPFGYITDANDVIGKQMKRHVQAGRILTPSQLRKPVVVKRGEIISIQKQASGFSINMKGIAMANGAIGDRIRVKNNSSKRIVEGTVYKAGIVTIGN